MIRINDRQKIKSYTKTYSMDELFSGNMENYMELFFFKKNEYLVKHSDKIRYLFFLVDGKAKVFTTLSNGKSLLLCFYQQFMVLGDVEILDSSEAGNNVQAIEDTYCIGIAIEHVRKYLMEDAKFLRFLCRSLGAKLNRCSKNSSINLLYSLETRLATYIYTTGEREKGSGRERIIFEENLTEIAELLGTSYRHLLRTLHSLCEKGILKKEGSQFEVVEEKILSSLSGDVYS